MNPYDFVSIDWDTSPERHAPVWHNRLTGTNDQRLYSGSIELDIYTETPLFIAEKQTAQPDPRRAAQSIKNRQGQYIIPGSSLKGMVRTVVEALGNGCLTLFDGRYEGYVNYLREVPTEFRKCGNKTNLCIACRIFGMLKEGAKGVFLGKVNIGDAIVDKTSLRLHDPLYTFATMNPRPHHEAFYLDESGTHIAGRKFYFHNKELLTSKTADKYNRYIQPLDSSTKFHTRIDFTTLEEEEFGALLFALTLKDNMRHKIGYGKPLGLGSIKITPTHLTLVDYKARYSRSNTNRGKTELQGNDVSQQVLNEYAGKFSVSHLVPDAMTDLQRIWVWPPDASVEYYYPSKRDWFDTEDSRGKRIADTVNVPRQR